MSRETVPSRSASSLGVHMKKILTNIEEIITGAALCVMTVLTVMNVFYRLFLSRIFTFAD